ncbi:hypothetical protein NQZ68_003429 [Dissostichus eleginoides]|nr:hypothetical protein NQZ68_003429 [Dissostichus eleginoides]
MSQMMDLLLQGIVAQCVHDGGGEWSRRAACSGGGLMTCHIPLEVSAGSCWSQYGRLEGDMRRPAEVRADPDHR